VRRIAPDPRPNLLLLTPPPETRWSAERVRIPRTPPARRLSSSRGARRDAGFAFWASVVCDNKEPRPGEPDASPRAGHAALPATTSRCGSRPVRGNVALGEASACQPAPERPKGRFGEIEEVRTRETPLREGQRVLPPTTPWLARTVISQADVSVLPKCIARGALTYRRS